MQLIERGEAEEVHVYVETTVSKKDLDRYTYEHEKDKKNRAARVGTGPTAGGMRQGGGSKS